MTSKLLFLSALAAGYLIGTRTGRDRFEQLAAAARDLADNPALQSAAGVLQGRAAELIANAREFGH